MIRNINALLSVFTRLLITSIVYLYSTMFLYQ